MAQLEFAGLLYGASNIGATKDGSTPNGSTPSLEVAIAQVLSEHSDRFGAVLTVGSSSLTLGAQDGLYYLFDSHGKHRAGFSTLMRFKSLHGMMAEVRSLFPQRRVEPEREGNELHRLRLNTYALHVLYVRANDNVD